MYGKMFIISLDLNTRSNCPNFTFSNTLRMQMIVTNQKFPVIVPEGKIRKRDWLRLEKFGYGMVSKTSDVKLDGD